jgi:hypothetical protein
MIKAPYRRSHSEEPQKRAYAMHPDRPIFPCLLFAPLVCWYCSTKVAIALVIGRMCAIRSIQRQSDLLRYITRGRLCSGPLLFPYNQSAFRFRLIRPPVGRADTDRLHSAYAMRLESMRGRANSKEKQKAYGGKTHTQTYVPAFSNIDDVVTKFHASAQARAQIVWRDRSITAIPVGPNDLYLDTQACCVC